MRTSPIGTSPLMSTFDHWIQPSYEIRVRGTMYLWGSAGITENITFDKPLLLHIRNEVLGDAVTIGTQVASGTTTTIGSLEPGQCVSVPVQGISGVVATCATESVVACLIKNSA
jgi:hypothetical protein